MEGLKPKTFTIGDREKYEVLPNAVRDHKKRRIKDEVYVKRISRFPHVVFRVQMPLEVYFRNCSYFHPLKITSYYEAPDLPDW